MSGIVGILNIDGSPVDRSLLARLTDYLAFRGPDAQETWSQGPVGLGHTLFQTVDDTGPDSQPLSLDGEVVVSPSGLETMNLAEVLAEAREHGHQLWERMRKGRG